MISLLLSFIQALSIPLTSPVHKPLAYLDPGSGSFILQIVLAALLASLFFMRTYWRKLINKFRKPSPDDEDNIEDIEEEHKEQ